jgi:hypothetical protein
MIVMVITFFLASNSQGGSKILAAATLLLVLAIGAYALVDHHDGHVVFQKVVALLAVVWFCLVFASVSVSTIRLVSKRRRIVEQQSLRYLEVMKRNPRRRYK